MFPGLKLAAAVVACGAFFTASAEDRQIHAGCPQPAGVRYEVTLSETTGVMSVGDARVLFRGAFARAAETTFVLRVRDQALRGFAFVDGERPFLVVTRVNGRQDLIPCFHIAIPISAGVSN